ncbi:MAG: M15 family metallopeptidase [Saprospiraceae bacterium]|nr:M15 family metallopeptidase [Saprospiraceae bacterium]
MILRWLCTLLLKLAVPDALPAPVPPVAPLPPPVQDTLPKPVSAKPRFPDYDSLQWTDVALADSSIVLDLKYATTDNFVETQLYECPRCLLRPQVTQALLRALRELKSQGYGFKMYDCYRPLPIQWKLWEKVPDRRYVADPRKGSMHNRGAAVDLTLTDSTGLELDMGTPFDFFGKKAYHAYLDLPEDVLKRRVLLKTTMERHGFQATKTEWWHYAYVRQNYALSDYVWDCP